MANKLNPFHLVRQMTSLIREVLNISEQSRKISDLMLFQQTKELQLSHPNPLNGFGKKCFSQADEDGITIEILKRIDSLTGGTYAEFGVGDGMENNTLILAALGWKGFWAGGESLRPQIKSNRFAFLKEWITAENINQIMSEGLSKIGASNVDLISLDLDGNDIYLAERLLSADYRPKLFIVEYNAKFPPPIEFQMQYNPKHVWENDDYFGASLCSFDKLFAKFKYRLLCCNSQTGVNAFFIDDKYSGLFPDVPADINKIYVEPRYHLYNKYGHMKSPRTVEQLFNHC